MAKVKCILAEQREKVSNENLLINSDFRRPVNRNGQTEYGKNSWTIDGWKTGGSSTLKILPHGIEIATTGTSGLGISQQLKNAYYGQELTFTVLTADNELITGTDTAPQSMPEATVIFIRAVSADQSCRAEVSCSTDGKFIVQYAVTNGHTSTVIAAKLELGSQQTLAHQNTDGVWELIDPPNYDFQYALCSLYSPITGEWVGSQHSNTNLLRNWYFLHPVNQSGRTEYTGTTSMLTIDKWRTSSSRAAVTLTEEGLTLTVTGASAWLIQSIENFESLKGKQVTLSCLYDTSKSTVWPRFRRDGTLLKTGVVTTDNAGLSTATMILPDDISSSLGVDLLVSSDSIGTIFAAKLELGPVQTLARQNADGEWVLNDPPDYDLQYALCSQYSPSTGEWIGSQHSNLNLLDNYYLLDPINQRGQQEYIDAGYTIDRWVTRNYSSSGVVKVALSSEGITFNLLKIPNNQFALAQVTENATNLTGKQVTFSILCKTVGTIKVHPLIKKDSNKNQFAVGTISNSNDWCCLSCTGIVPETASAITPFIQTYDGDVGDNVIIAAAKLELGPVQTLAHKEGDTWVLNDPPPNKALELAKCQRYQQVIKSNNNLENITLGEGIYLRDGNIVLSIPSLNLRTTPASITLNKNVVIGKGILNETTTFATRINFISYRPDSPILMLQVAASQTDNSLTVGESYRVGLLGGNTLILDANL